jgi:hypothetical protein
MYAKENIMANFDMRGQRVTNQYNAGQDINFGAVQTPEDLVTVLEQLNAQFLQAKEAGILSEEAATDAQYQVTKAAQQAKKPDPNKKRILDHLSNAKGSIENLTGNITAVGGLITAVAAAIQVVQKVFS